MVMEYSEKNGKKIEVDLPKHYKCLNFRPRKYQEMGAKFVPREKFLFHNTSLPTNNYHDVNILVVLLFYYPWMLINPNLSVDRYTSI